MEENISLQDIFKVIKKRIVLILSTLVLAVAIAGGISYFYLTPIYEASSQILINQKTTDPNQKYSPDIEENLQLINTYYVIITNRVILTKVIENLNLNTTPEKMVRKIKVSSEQNSQVINISVQDTSLEQAVKIANMTVSVFQEEIPKLMNVDNVNVLSPAINAEYMNPIKPAPILNMAIAAILGIVIGVGITFLLEFFNTKIKTEQDICELLELPILGIVSPITIKKEK